MLICVETSRIGFVLVLMVAKGLGREFSAPKIETSRLSIPCSRRKEQINICELC